MADNGRPTSDDDLVLALAAGVSVAEAAGRAGVGERTAYRRLLDADFRRRVSEARGRLFDTALGRLANIATKAADTLERLMESDKPTVALGAARSVLELGPRLREAVELEERLAILESGGQTAPPSEGTDDDTVSDDTVSDDAENDDAVNDDAVNDDAVNDDTENETGQDRTTAA